MRTKLYCILQFCFIDIQNIEEMLTKNKETRNFGIEKENCLMCSVCLAPTNLFTRLVTQVKNLVRRKTQVTFYRIVPRKGS